MDEAKNFMLSMMNTLKERIGNPFIGAFAAAWVIWNFKIVLVIFGKGDGGWKEKIKYIYSDLMVSNLDWFLHGYLFPFIAASLWIFALPKILREISVWHEDQRNKTRKAMYEVSERRVLTKEEEVSLRTHMVEERLRVIKNKEDIFKSLQETEERYNLKSKEVQEKEKEIEIIRIAKDNLENTNSELLLDIEKLNFLVDPPDLYINKNDFKGQSEINKLIRQIGFKVDDQEDSLHEFSRHIKYNVVMPAIIERNVSYDGVIVFTKDQILDSEAILYLLLISEYCRKKSANPISSQDFAGLFPFGLTINRYLRDKYFNKYKYLDIDSDGNKYVVFHEKAINAGLLLSQIGFVVNIKRHGVVA